MQDEELKALFAEHREIVSQNKSADDNGEQSKSHLQVGAVR